MRFIYLACFLISPFWCFGGLWIIDESDNKIELRLHIYDIQSLPPEKIFLAINTYINTDLHGTYILKLEAIKSSWELVELNPTKEFTGYSKMHGFNTVWFLMNDHQEGPLFVSGVFSTHNQGESWSFAQTKGLSSFSSIRFFELVSKSVAIISALKYGDSNDHNDIVILKTTNGGKKWNPIFTDKNADCCIEKEFIYPNFSTPPLHTPIWKEVDDKNFLVGSLIRVVNKDNVFSIQKYMYEKSTWATILEIQSRQVLSKNEKINWKVIPGH